MTQRGQTNGFCREITKTLTDKIGADVLYIWVVSVFLLVVVLRELLLRPANYQDCLLSTEGRQHPGMMRTSDWSIL